MPGEAPLHIVIKCPECGVEIHIAFVTDLGGHMMERVRGTWCTKCLCGWSISERREKDFVREYYVYGYGPRPL